MTTAKKTTKKTAVKKTKPRTEYKKPDLTDPNKVICLNIKALYKMKKLEEKWTREDMAEFLEVDYPYIKGVLQGQFAPSHRIIIRIVKKFQVSPDWLYGMSIHSPSKIQF